MAVDLIIRAKVEGNAKQELNDLKNAGEQTSRSTDKLASSFSSLSGILAGVGFAALAKEAIGMADTYKLMEARLSLVSKSTTELVSSQSKLFQMAQNSRSSLEATTGLYTKLAMATENMGKSQKEVLSVTDAVGKALKISGAGAAEASSAMLQLGQALASGTLRGDELNSIMENAPRLAKAIADGMGVSIGQLRTLGADGKLIAQDVFNAIEKSGSKLNEEFKKIPPTVQDSLTIVNDNIMKSVAEFDKLNNITGTVAQTLATLGKSIDSNTISTLVNVVTSAVVAFTSYRAIVLSTVAVQTSYNWWVAATTATTSTYNIATNMTTASTTRLSVATGIATIAQRGFNAAVSANPLVIAALVIAGGIALVTSKIMEYNQALDKQGAAYKKSSDAYNKSYGKTIVDVGESLQKLEDKRKSFEIGMNNAKTAGNTAAYNIYKKNVQDVTKEINAHNDAINTQISSAQKASKQTTASFSPTGETKEQRADRIKAEKEALKLQKKQNKEAEKERLIKLGYLEGYADLEAKQALDLYNTQLGYEESYRDIQAQNAIDQYNENVSNLNAWADLEAQAAIKKFEDETKFWDDLFANVNKAMDNQFFDAMTGKFKSFGSWLKDFWSSITDSMARGLSKTLADSILGTGTSGGGLQNIFKSFGGLGSVFGSVATPSSMLGSTTDAMGFTTTAGGTVLDAVGNITKSGTDVSSVISQLSNANSLYSAATNGITGMIYAPSAYMGQLAGTAYGAGFTGTGSFLAGSSQVLAGGGIQGLSGSAFAGGLATAGVAGGIGGYAIGSLGDKIFGADTKAANYGAIGGAAGAMIGSVVPVVGTIIGGLVGAALGSVIGGAFGKTTKKLQDYGVMAYGTQSADGVDLDNYQTIKTTKKSWFKKSSKTRTSYTDMEEKQQEAIRATFETYDYLLTQMGDLDTTFVEAGKYSKDTFMDAMNKSFISAFVDDKSMTGAFYTAWQEYATSINKAVSETFAQVIGGYVGTTRSFKEWSLGSGSVEQLKFTSDYLSKDLSSLQAQMGVSGVTVDNYLEMYDKAIKDTFTPETIESWKTLGSALMTATDANNAYISANDKYIDSMKDAVGVVGVVPQLPQDMMLGKTSDGSSIFQKLIDDNTTIKLMYADMLRTMKSMLTIQQFGVVVA